MEKKPFQIVIYGKEGCQKCHVLNQRVDRLLKKEEWSDFSKVYYDVLTEPGLVEFCNAECINPQRIPALTVKRYNATLDDYEYIPNPSPGVYDPICGSSKLYTYLGVQTDYSASGIITLKMIKSILITAKAL